MGESVGHGLPSDVFQYLTDLPKVIEYINVLQHSKDCISVVVSESSTRRTILTTRDSVVETT